MTSYPGSIDNWSNPSASDTLGTAPHSSLHTEERDAIEQLETKVGTGQSDAANAADGAALVADGSGGTAWDNGAFLPPANYRAGDMSALGRVDNNAITTTNEQLVAIPYWIPPGFQIVSLAVRVNSAGETDSVCRLGVATAGSDGWPDTIVENAGTVAVDAISGKRITGLTVARPSDGWVFALGCVQGAPTTPPDLIKVEHPHYPLVRDASITAIALRRTIPIASGVSGAFPASWPAAGRTINDAATEAMHVLVEIGAV